MMNEVPYFCLIGLSLIITQSVIIKGQTQSTVKQMAPTSPVPAAPNRTEGSNGAWVRVLGRSGRIVIGSNRDPDQDANRVTLEFVGLAELDQNGNEIPLNDHRMQNFAGQDFSFGAVRESRYQNLTARFFEYSARVQDSFNARLQSNVYILNDSGEIVHDNETLPVQRGNIKMTYEFTNWQFCGREGGRGVECIIVNQDYRGQGLEFVIRIRSPGRPQERNENEKRTRGIRGAKDFNIGSGRSIVLSTKVRYDGSDQYEDMEDGYPLLRTRGSATEFVFRFRRFNISAVYDPTIDLQLSSDNSGNTGFKAYATPALLVLMILLHLM